MPLSAINIGSNEIALIIDDSLKALELLKEKRIVVFVGDILSKGNNSLIYAYQLWGEEYHCLNWYCNKLKSENQDYYLSRSHVLAEESIINAEKVAQQLKKNCCIVFITP